MVLGRGARDWAEAPGLVWAETPGPERALGPCAPFPALPIEVFLGLLSLARRDCESCLEGVCGLMAGFPAELMLFSRGLRPPRKIRAVIRLDFFF